MHCFAQLFQNKQKNDSSQSLFSNLSQKKQNSLIGSGYAQSENNPFQSVKHDQIAVWQPLGTSLKVGKADDQYERQAGHVAGQIMRMPESPERLINSQRPALKYHIPSQPCSEILLQTNLQNSRIPDISPQIQTPFKSSRNTGRPLPVATQSFFESRFGTEFSDTRIHAGSEAVATARVLNARAFTVGRDIFFNQGEFQPSTVDGKRLLAHELTHVLQQQQLSPRIQREEESPDEDSERSSGGND